MRLFIRRSVFELTNQEFFSGTSTLYMFADDDIDEGNMKVGVEDLIEIEIRAKNKEAKKPKILEMHEAKHGVSNEPMKEVFVSTHYSGPLPSRWVPDDRMAMFYIDNRLSYIEIESATEGQPNVTLTLKNTLEHGTQQFQGYDGRQEIWITHLPGTLEFAFFYGNLNSLEKKIGKITGICDQLSLSYE